MIIIAKAEKVDDALFEYHLELVSFIKNKIKNIACRKIVEIGSGPGTFTLPLLKEFGGNFEIFYCIDSYLGPYSKDRQVLETKLAAKDIRNKVKIIEKNALEMDSLLSEIDLVIGHEVFCTLSPKHLRRVISVCYNVLGPGGRLIHSDFAPFALNRSEELVQIINDYSEEDLSEIPWFSPPAEELAKISYKCGFREINLDYIKLPIKFKNTAALGLLRRWQTKNEFIDKYHAELTEFGIEFPMEQILYCRK